MAPTRPAARKQPALRPPGLPMFDNAALAPPLRRSNRLANLPPVAAAPDTTDSRITKESAPKAKAKAKPKAKPKQECVTCGRKLALSSFPAQPVTTKCNHPITTCKSCTKTHIAVSLDNITYDRLACPECPEVLENADVLRLATKEVHTRFDELERRGIAEKIPGWRWCLNPRCRAGQVHEPSLAASKSEVGGEAASLFGPPLRSSKRIVKKSSVYSEDVCVCNDCGFKACATCNVNYHEGESCAQYQKRREAEEEATRNTIETTCKHCPKCSKNIEKNGGCDAVFCTQCYEHFCWLCLTSYDIINQKGHGEGCIYAKPGRFDPHAAPNAPGNAVFQAPFGGFVGNVFGGGAGA